MKQPAYALILINLHLLMELVWINALKNIMLMKIKFVKFALMSVPHATALKIV
jgi:hypothetical protein